MVLEADLINFVKDLKKINVFFKIGICLRIIYKLRDTLLPATPDIPKGRAIQCTI